MDYEIDLELYTITIVSMNSAFSKLEADEFDDGAIMLLNESLENFEKIYQSTLIDLSMSEINYGEYDYFLLNVYSAFPGYIESIEIYNQTVINNELKAILNELKNLFASFIKIAEDYFKKRGVLN